MKENTISLIIFLVYLADYWPSVTSECPSEVGSLKRIGKTRYFLDHNKTRGGYVNWTMAKLGCQKAGLQMATVRHQVTLAVLGRALEIFVNEHVLKDTWYWLDATYSEKLQGYVWGGKETDPVLFSDILYRHPRPTGLGSQIASSGKYNKSSTVEQCLTLALPWPGHWEQERYQTFFGHQAILDERPCESVQKRHMLCESRDKNCNATDSHPFVLSETKSKIDYFDTGDWIAGDRNFVINWKRRTFEQAVSYCNESNLVMLEPGPNVQSLIPYLKMWSREMTVAQFWTGLTYDAHTGKFFNAKGQEVKTSRIKFQETNILEKRSNKNDSIFCVAVSWSYEFVGQSPCLDPESTACSWSFMDYIPTNCQGYFGTVCQHQDSSQREFVWKPTYTKNLATALKELALTKEYGYVGNNLLLRSNYKGYKMLRKETDTITTSRLLQRPANVSDSDVFHYDYTQSYWLVDGDEFGKTNTSNCLVSVYKPGRKPTIEYKNTSCTEFHFYLCERMQANSTPSVLTPTKQPEVVWKEGPQGRTYPLLEPGTPSKSPTACGGDENVTVQLAFVLDITRSMKDHFPVFIKSSQTILETISKKYPRTTFSLSVFADWDDYSMPTSNKTWLYECYWRRKNFTNDPKAFSKVSLTMMGSGPLIEEAGIHAVGFAAADKSIGWLSQDDLPPGQTLRKFAILLTDAGSRFNLSYPGERGEFQGDGTDNCLTSKPLTIPKLNEVLKREKVDVIGFYSTRKIVKEYKDLWFNFIDVKYCTDYWAGNGGFKKLPKVVVGCVENILSCNYQDPIGYNTLGF